ncbi:MAG: penicillin-insensitive murein endopeptidase [Candidatus Lernaella stagnicola]|nr:penicillin-insensitive murein endopeptidase [Candidatus Lernaella stagnicola]
MKQKLAILGTLLLALSLAACSGMRRIPEKTGSVGRCNDGYLVGGVQLPSSGEIIVLEPQFAYGTPTLVHSIEAAAADMRANYPDTVSMVVGHLSRPEGGPLRPHKSHQSGRDFDVAYYAKDNQLIRGFVDMRRGKLDVAKTWEFIELMLEHADVQYILMDWDVQKIMYEELRLFESEWKLRKLFQYPRKPGNRTGVIRHAPSHHNHMHIRIHCPDDDWFCLD